MALEPYLSMVGRTEAPITAFAVAIKVDGAYVGAAGIEPSPAEIDGEPGLPKPFEAGGIARVFARGSVVAHPDPGRVGTSVAAGDPPTIAARRAAETQGVVDLDGIRPDGSARRSTARSFAAGGAWTAGRSSRRSRRRRRRPRRLRSAA